MKETQYQKYLKQVKHNQKICFVINFFAGFITVGLFILFMLNYFK